MPAAAWTTLARYNLQKGERFLFHVGSNQWYKNRLGLIALFAALRSRPEGKLLKLVMAGKPWTRDIREAVYKHNLQASVLECTDVTNEDLCAFYSVAQAFLFPSLYEGFGWPIIEAQACGCPVFATAREPMLSVGGEGAHYFDPDNLQEAALIVLQGLRNQPAMRVAGLRNAARFSTERMIAGYDRQYRQVFDER